MQNTVMMKIREIIPKTKSHEICFWLAVERDFACVKLKNNKEPMLVTDYILFNDKWIFHIDLVVLDLFQYIQ